MKKIINYIKWGFESRLKLELDVLLNQSYYIKWGFESRLKQVSSTILKTFNYIKWGFESRLKQKEQGFGAYLIISNGYLRVDCKEVLVS